MARIEVAYFASGCFWSKEYLLGKLPGVIGTRVGYMGGHLPNPTYRDVCTKSTGHAETVELTFDAESTSFEALARYFFEIHDPTRDRRARGGQYRSAIFPQNESQRQVARQLLAKLSGMGYAPVTTLESADQFWEAEERHQGYCELRGMDPRPERVPRFERPARRTA